MCITSVLDHFLSVASAVLTAGGIGERQGRCYIWVKVMSMEGLRMRRVLTVSACRSAAVAAAGIHSGRFEINIFHLT